MASFITEFLQYEEKFLIPLEIAYKHGAIRVKPPASKTEWINMIVEPRFYDQVTIMTSLENGVSVKWSGGWTTSPRDTKFIVSFPYGFRVNCMIQFEPRVWFPDSPVSHTEVSIEKFRKFAEVVDSIEKFTRIMKYNYVHDYAEFLLPHDLNGYIKTLNGTTKMSDLKMGQGV